MSAQPSVLQVVILRDGLLVGTEVFVPGTYSVGSDPSSDLRLDDPSIDPRHALLYFQNGRSAIQDAGSNQGVFVNGHRVTACEIRSVDEVLCGPFVLKTRILSQKPAEKPPPSAEMAALLGGPPAAQPPQAAVRPLRPAPQQATMPARASAAVPAVSTPAPAEVLATTVPTAYSPQHAARGAAPQAAVVPIAQPPQHRGPPAASRGGPAVAHAQQPMPAPAVMPVQPAPAAPVPANTVPSARRRATQDVMPAADPGIHLADDLFNDLLPPEEPLEEQAPIAPQPQQAPVARAPAPRQAQAPVARSAPQVAHAGHAPAVQLPDPPRPTTAPKLGPGKGKALLYLELYWGGIRRDARSYSGGKEPLKANTEEKKGGMPLWGFSVPEEGFTLAEALNGAYRLYVPPGSAVEKANSGGRYTPVQVTALEADGTRRFITLRDGTAARVSQGNMSLVAYAAPKPDKVFVNPLSGLPWLAMFCFLLFGGGFGAFIVMKPEMPESPDFQQKNLPPVALRLLAPEPKKKEEAKKKLEAIKEKAKKPAEKPVEKPVEKPKVVEKTPPPKAKEVAPPPPESKALKALAKLSAAGPATNDVLAAVDKLGSGPGSKNVKTSNYKLSGLIGKAPIANAGLGTFGLGGGGKGGGATLGAELLRGKGGGGIGALGAGGVGKGQVGGVVTRATSRSVAAPQGSIDREAVAKVINSHLQEVYGCYERALLKDTGLAGKVVLEWTIGAGGSVVAAKTKSSTLRNGAVEACILSSLKKWTFPAPKGGLVIISYPFIFNSVGY